MPFTDHTGHKPALLSAKLLLFETDSPFIMDHKSFKFLSIAQSVLDNGTVFDINMFGRLTPVFNGAVWFYSVLIQYADNGSLYRILSNFNDLQNCYDLIPSKYLPPYLPTIPTIINLMRKELLEKRCRTFLQFNRKYYTFNIEQSTFALGFSSETSDALRFSVLFNL